MVFGGSYLVASALLFVGYLALLAIYRLYLSPIAKFPGPKLAALSNWYEFYYDVVKQGDFTWQIQRLHKKFGPIVRITPTELHIDDPEHYDVMYTRGTGRRDRYWYFSGRFGYASDTFSTIEHDLHRQRRKAISPFFSVTKIADFQPVIRAKIDKFCDKLADYAAVDGAVVPLSRGWMALTTDIITEYSFARSYDQLDSPEFVETLTEALVAVYVTGHFALHFPVVFPILDMLPEWFVRWGQPDILPVVGMRKDLAQKVHQIRDGKNLLHESASHQTIFHELLNNPDLPESEKSDARLGDEAQLIVAAGLITTSWALSVANYHMAENRSIAARLRADLASVEQPYDWRQLERVPLLNAIVHESMRLAHGIVTRDPRVAPDAELTYREWTIPRNTPVSMTTYDILMNEDIFPEPKRFNPDRWIEHPELEKFFVPFGKGSRQCAGINLAQAELYIAIATVYSRFEFTLFETGPKDVEMAHAYLVPYTDWESKGIRGTVRKL